MDIVLLLALEGENIKKIEMNDLFVFFQFLHLSAAKNKDIAHRMTVLLFLREACVQCQDLGGSA